MTTTQSSTASGTPCSETLPVRTALQLRATAMLSLPLQAGDQLRGECGTVWATIDGQLQDILLQPGETYTVGQTGALNVSALDSACVSVLSRAPLTWRRVRPEAAHGWAALRRLMGGSAGPAGPASRQIGGRPAAPTDSGSDSGPVKAASTIAFLPLVAAGR